MAKVGLVVVNSRARVPQELIVNAIDGAGAAISDVTKKPLSNLDEGRGQYKADKDYGRDSHQSEKIARIPSTYFPSSRGSSFASSIHGDALPVRLN